MGSLRLHDGEANVGGPLEERPQVVAIGIERTAEVLARKAAAATWASSKPGSSMMVARVFESESSTDMALLLQLGEPANTGLGVVD
jgi:hypothetical protein